MRGKNNNKPQQQHYYLAVASECFTMNQRGLFPIMEQNNQAASLILQKDYALGREKLATALHHLQSHHVVQSEPGPSTAPNQPPSSTSSSELGNCSLDCWLCPAARALHDDNDDINDNDNDTGGSSSSSNNSQAASLFIYRMPIFVPAMHISRVRNSENENHHINDRYPTRTQVNLVVTMLFNYGLACHLEHHHHYLRHYHNVRIADGSPALRSGTQLLEKASQMYDFAIQCLRYLNVGSSSEARNGIIASNLHFFERP